MNTADTMRAALPDEVLQLLNHIEDVIGDEAWARIDAMLWNAVTKLAAGAKASPEKEQDAVDTLTEEGWIWDGDQWQRPPHGVAPARQYLHPTRVDALITVLEGECELTVTRETAEAILHYLENAPAGVKAGITVPWPESYANVVEGIAERNSTLTDQERGHLMDLSRWLRDGVDLPDGAKHG